MPSPKGSIGSDQEEEKVSGEPNQKINFTDEMVFEHKRLNVIKNKILNPKCKLHLCSNSDKAILEDTGNRDVHVLSLATGKVLQTLNSRYDRILIEDNKIIAIDNDGMMKVVHCQEATESKYKI